MYNSIFLNLLTGLCDDAHNLMLEHFKAPSKGALCPSAVTSIAPSPSAAPASHQLSASMHCPILNTSYKSIHTIYGLTSLSYMSHIFSLEIGHLDNVL